MQKELKPIMEKTFEKQYAEAVPQDQKMPPLFRNIAKNIFINTELERAALIRKRGVVELVSDLVAVLIFGPASFFAFYQFAIQEEMDTLPNERFRYYPPWRMRLRLAYEYLKEKNFLEYHKEIDDDFSRGVDAFFKKIKTIIEDNNDQEILKRDDTINCAYESIRRTIPDTKKFIDNFFRDKQPFSARDLYENFNDLLKRIEDDIPPNAIENYPDNPKPVRIEKILNVAWFYKISKFPNIFVHDEIDTETYYKKMDILNRLTLKAMEWSQIQSQYQQYRKEKNERTLQG